MLLSDMTWMMTSIVESTFGLLTLVLIGSEIFLGSNYNLSKMGLISNRLKVSLLIIGHDVTFQEDPGSDLSVHLHVFR